MMVAKTGRHEEMMKMLNGWEKDKFQIDINSNYFVLVCVLICALHLFTL